MTSSKHAAIITKGEFHFKRLDELYNNKTKYKLYVKRQFAFNLSQVSNIQCIKIIFEFLTQHTFVWSISNIFIIVEMHLLFRVSFVDSTEVNHLSEFAVLSLTNLSTGQSIHVQRLLHDVFNGNI